MVIMNKTKVTAAIYNITILGQFGGKIECPVVIQILNNNDKHQLCER
jgi:hypothetical protein